MKSWLVGVLSIAVVAGGCAPPMMAEPEPGAPPPTVQTPAPEPVESPAEPVLEPEPAPTMAPAAEPAAESAIETQPAPAAFTPSCGGVLKQGGLAVCELPPGARVFKNAASIATTEDGVVVIGLSQHEDPSVTISWTAAGDNDGSIDLAIAARKDEFRELTGLECDKVDARTPEQKAHAARSWTTKVNAFARFEAPVAQGLSFSKPANGPYTSPFGPTRHYSGVSSVTGKTCESTSVHQGLDMATPVGTPLKAPMAGVVTLADPDLYYEGGAIFLDHGRGLVSVFMHLSGVSVEPGQVVQAGDVLGATGNTGRTTGPHLHWAVKWRPLDTSAGSGFYIDPALLLTMDEVQPDVEKPEQDPAP